MINLSPDNLAEIKRILGAHVPDCEVRAFGSRVTGGVKPYSDLDIAIMAPDRLSIFVIGALREAFQESALPFRIDVCDWHSMPDSSQQAIERQHEVIQMRTPELAAP